MLDVYPAMIVWCSKIALRRLTKSVYWPVELPTLVRELCPLYTNIRKARNSGYPDADSRRHVPSKVERIVDIHYVLAYILITLLLAKTKMKRISYKMRSTFDSDFTSDKGTIQPLAYASLVPLKNCNQIKRPFSSGVYYAGRYILYLIDSKMSMLHIDLDP